MLATSGLKFSYDTQTKMHFPDIKCQRGESWLLLGDSGTGKTTLLHVLGGLRTPKEGKVIIADTDLYDLSSAQMDRFRGKHIGIIFQEAHFLKALTVKENLAVAQQLGGHSVSSKKIKSILDQLNIGHKINAKTTNLSQGEQQRVAIARALINEPAVILADEPTSALDDNNCREVVRLLETQAKAANAVLIIVTHDGRLKKLFPKNIHLNK